MEKYVTKYSFKNKEVLYGASWEIEKPVANVVILTGMEEHTLRYTDLALFLNKHGLSVFAVDYYGQGENIVHGNVVKGSVPKNSFQKFVSHIKEVVVKLSLSGLPVYVIGHSMGSFLVQRIVQIASEYIAKAIVIGSNGPDFAFHLGKIVAKLTVNKKNWNKTSKLLSTLSVGMYAKSIKGAKTPLDWLSYNEENVTNYIANPLDGGPSAKGFYYELLHGTSGLYKKSAYASVRRELPLLFLAGKEDPVGHNGKGVIKLHKFYYNLGFNDTKLVIYEKMRHEILNEDEKEKVYNEIHAFLIQ